MSTFTAIIHKEDNLFVAQCPEIGTASQGETFEAALKNLKEATELYLEEFHSKETCRTIFTTFEVPVEKCRKNSGPGQPRLKKRAG
jgi:predicted RNase H-like HicB family nuclease